MSETLRCAEAGCDAQIKNHAWSKIKSGWFEQKNGDNWCPKHIPAWVEKWRAKQ